MDSKIFILKCIKPKQDELVYLNKKINMKLDIWKTNSET